MEKEFLTSKGVAYENRFVDENEAAREEMVKTTNQMGVPVTILDYGDAKHYLVGFNQPALEKALGGEKVGYAID